MEEIIREYTSLCRMIGGWTDWVQGPGGNVSIKNGNQLVIKRSGALLADTTREKGWVICDIQQVMDAYNSNNELITHTVQQGEGNPSIETFLHCLPDRIIVHLHPAFLLGELCKSNEFDKDLSVGRISYAKPGIPLAKLLFNAYIPNRHIYMLENHGILLTGNTIAEIIDQMSQISKQYKPPFLNHLPFTNVAWAAEMFKSLSKKNHQEWILQPIGSASYHGSNIQPFTPDIAVFLTESSILSDGEQIYCVGMTLHQCMILRELYMSHQYAIQGGACKTLSSQEVHELRSWDKEKLRKGP